jgi:hypothetical protein
MTQPIDRDDEALVRELFGETYKDNLKATLDRASRSDPDQEADIRKLSDKTGMHPQLVRSSPDEARRRAYMDDVIPEDLSVNYPRLSTYLSNPDNAAVSVDDVETLKFIEDHYRKAPTQSTRGFSNNALRGVAETFSRIGTGSLSGTAWGAEEASKVFTRPNDVLVRLGYEMLGKEYPGGAEQILQDAEAGVRTWADRVEKQSKRTYQYENRADIDAVVEDPSLSTVGKFIAEAAPAALPYLLASMVSPWLVYPGIQDQIAKERMQNEGEGGIPTDKNMAIAAPFAAASGLVERYTAGKIFKGGGPPTGGLLGYAATEVPKAGAREFIGEFAQGGTEAIGGMVGTDKGLVWSDVGKQALGEGLAGFGVGVGARSAPVVPEYRYHVLNATIKAAGRRLDSAAGQDWLDGFMELAQSSKTNERAAENFKALIDSMPEDARVFLSSDVAAELEGAPDYIVSQLDGTGADVTMSMSQFVADFMSDEQRLAFVRPHIKVRDDLQTLSEMEANVDSASVARLIERAKAKQDAMTESDRVYETIKDQLVAPGRLSESTARIQAEIIPAYIVAKQAEYKEAGRDISIQQLYDDMLLRIVGPRDTVNVEQDTVELSSRPLVNVPLSLISEFPDFQLTEEGLLAVNNLRPEEVQSLRDAGVVQKLEGARENGEAYSYEAVDPELLWEERKLRQKDGRPKSPAGVDSEIVENRIRTYERLAKEQEDLGDLGDAELISKYRSKAEDLRGKLSAQEKGPHSPRILAQDDLDFGDKKYTRKVGNKSVTVNAQDMWDNIQQRFEMVEALRECMKIN